MTPIVVDLDEEPIELQNDVPLIFKMPSAAADGVQGLARFNFDVEEPYVVKISTWWHSGSSQPNLFVNIENENVGPKSFIFRSIREGEN